MEKIIFLLLLNILKKTEIILNKEDYFKEKNKIKNCKDFNLTGIMCEIYEIDKKYSCIHNYNFIKKRKKAINQKQNNLKFIFKFIGVISLFLKKIFKFIKFYFWQLINFLKVNYNYIFEFLSNYCMIIFDNSICFLIQIFNFFSSFNKNKDYLKSLLYLENKKLFFDWDQYIFNFTEKYK